MSNFLTKKQQYDLKKQGWKLIDDESGTAWFGADFEEHWIHHVTELLEINEDCDGMDFLVIGYKPTNDEEEEFEEGSDD